MPIEKMIFQIFSAMVTTCGFGLMFNIKNKNLIHTSIAGGLKVLQSHQYYIFPEIKAPISLYFFHLTSNLSPL